MTRAEDKVKKTMIRRIVVMGIVFLLSLQGGAFLIAFVGFSVSAATFYIDFDGGLDSRAGTSSEQSWQHCPGDTNATGTAASTTPTPGDTIVFKGGVHYRGAIKCKSSGSTGNPIVYDGNTAGNFGSGQAIIDGSENLTNWTLCVSAADCGGNPNWTNIYKATVPTNMDVFSANMYENDQMLWPSQNPNLKDPHFADDLTTFTPISSDRVTRTNLTDVNTFTQADSNYYAGCYIRLWGEGNSVRILPITGYIPEENRITFADTGANSLYTNRTVYYALVNHASFVDVPGEYSVNGTTHTLYLWPLNGVDPYGETITYGVRRRGFDFNGKSNVTIQGFKIQKMTSGAKELYMGCGIIDQNGGSGNTVRNNEVTKNYAQDLSTSGSITMTGGGTNVVIDTNYIHENPHSRGILATIRNSVVSRNTLQANGGTAIAFFGCRNSQMVRNIATGNLGVHANGLSVYLGSSNCLVAYNTVFDGAIALTLQDSRNITVAYNLLQTAQKGPTSADWSSAKQISDGIYYYNNIMLNSYNQALFLGNYYTNVVVRNNILDGCSFNVKNAINVTNGASYSHNIYTSLHWQQSANSGWSLSVGESVQTNKSRLFVDPEKRDFHLKSGSPAIDAGIDVGFAIDLDRQPVPTGDAPDIGAYEYRN